MTEINPYSSINPNKMMQFEIPKERPSIIKVIGVGGGGSNAVNYMYRLGIKGVDFLVCNTDHQALEVSPVPAKIQLGPSLTEGRGAGSLPEVGKNAAIENLEEIREVLRQNTKMVFITAGMGGGTGTGAAPIIAGVAREMGILTVGIVTIPFAFEGKKRKAQADAGIEELKKNVDTLLIICNDKLRSIYGDLKLSDAFGHADNILSIAAKSIAEIITTTMHINVDFADIQTVMKDSGVAIMGSATAAGENRAVDAVKKALDSPLLNDNDIEGARFILLNISSGSPEVTMDEMGEITDFVQEKAGQSAEVIMGVGNDESLGNHLNVTLIATGFKTRDQLDTIIDKPEEKIVYNLDGKILNEKDTPVESRPAPAPKAKPEPEPAPFEPVLIIREPAPVTQFKPVAVSAPEPVIAPVAETPAPVIRHELPIAPAVSESVAPEVETKPAVDASTPEILAVSEPEVKMELHPEKVTEPVGDNQLLAETKVEPPVVRATEPSVPEMPEIPESAYARETELIPVPVFETEEEETVLLTIEPDEPPVQREVSMEAEEVAGAAELPVVSPEPAAELPATPVASIPAPEPVAETPPVSPAPAPATEPEKTFVFEINAPVAAQTDITETQEPKSDSMIQEQQEAVSANDKDLVSRKLSGTDFTPVVKQEEPSYHEDDPYLRAKERINQLKALSMKMNAPGGLNDLEKEPAYKRRNVTLDQVPASGEAPVSRFTLSNDAENKPEIKSNNSFLHDRVD